MNLEVLSGTRSLLPEDEEQQLLAHSVNASKAAILITDPAATIVYANDGVTRLLGYKRQQLLGKSALSFLNQQNMLKQQLIQIKQGISYEDDIELYNADGQPRWFNINISPVFSKQQQLTSTITVLTDNTANKLQHILQQKLADILQTEQSFASAVSLLYREIQHVAPQCSISVIQPDEHGQFSVLAGFSLPADARFRQVQLTDYYRDKLLITEQNGISAPIRDRTGKISALFCLYWNTDDGHQSLYRQLAVTACLLYQQLFERHEQQQSLNKMAHYDALTGLPNRNLLIIQANKVLKGVAREQTELTVVSINLNRFKQVNDVLGREKGDQLLKTVARRLKSLVRQQDIIGRLTGDEFVLVLPYCNASQATKLIERLLAILNEPAQIDGINIKLSASVGISLYPGDGKDISTLLQRADIAMNQAKSSKAGNFRFFLEEMNHNAHERLLLETALDDALTHKRLYLLYQPQIDMEAPDQLRGVEALARWHHPLLGEVSPTRFIPLAEECGLINKLSETVLQQACCQLAKWRHEGLNIPRVSVNLSALNFQNQQLPEFLQQLLTSYQLDAKDICLEVTENVLLDQHPDTVGLINTLHQMGFQLAIDDFGTGYSSLSYLRYIPVSELKLDKSFVDDLAKDAASTALSKAILAIGTSLNLQVVAEGIEEKAQYDILRKQGYHTGQGYLFSAPLPADKLATWLKQQNRI